MKYTPSEGRFAGQVRCGRCNAHAMTPDFPPFLSVQLGYGYRSFEAFVAAVQQINAGTAKPRDFDASLATVHTTQQGTAILEAGRRSLDCAGEGETGMCGSASVRRNTDATGSATCAALEGRLTCHRSRTHRSTHMCVLPAPPCRFPGSNRLRWGG